MDQASRFELVHADCHGGPAGGPVEDQLIWSHTRSIRVRQDRRSLPLSRSGGTLAPAQTGQRDLCIGRTGGVRAIVTYRLDLPELGSNFGSNLSEPELI